MEFGVLQPFNDGIIEIGDSKIYFPFPGIPAFYEVGDGPEAQKWNFLYQADIEKGSSFHVFNLPVWLVAKLFNMCSMTMCMKGGHAGSFCPSGEWLIRTFKNSIGKRKAIGITPA